MSQSSAAANQPRPRLKLSGPAEMVAAVPYLFGYVPTGSLVVIGLSGPRGRLSTSMRLDLAPTDDLEAMVASSMTFLRRDPPDRVVLVIYPDPDCAPPGMVHDAFADALADAGIGVNDVIMVDNARWWSLRCSNPECCPLEGTPVVAADSCTVAATAAMLGMNPPVESRADLESRVRPVGGDEVEAMRAAIDAACAAYAGEVTGLDLASRRAHAAARRAEGLRRIVVGVTGASPGPEAARLSDADAAWLIVALIDVTLRDAAIELGVEQGTSEDAEGFWLDLTRRAVDEWGAAPATIAGVLAWKAGSGTRARIAVDRALDCDRTYRLALLLERILDVGMPPSEWPTEMIEECT